MTRKSILSFSSSKECNLQRRHRLILLLDALGEHSRPGACNGGEAAWMGVRPTVG